MGDVELGVARQSQITNELMLNLGAYRCLSQNRYCYYKLFLELFLHQYTVLITGIYLQPKSMQCLATF